MDIYEVGLGIRSEGNKDQRSTAMVRHIFEDAEDPDVAATDLLNHLYVESSAAGRRMDTASFVALKSKVLDPRGVHYSEGEGFSIPAHAATTFNAPSDRSAPTAGGNDAMHSTTAPTEEKTPKDSSRVFVVYGRDGRPKDVLEQFLHFAGLGVIGWSDAVALTGEPQPHTFTIVKAGMDAAAAIIVIFSPDEEARLRDELVGDGSNQYGYQPRQNVLLEAGMAFAAAPERTIFVSSGSTRTITDIEGFNWVKLDGQWDSRQDLVKRLKTAGAAVSLRKADLRDPLAGPFQVSSTYETD